MAYAFIAMSNFSRYGGRYSSRTYHKAKGDSWRCHSELMKQYYLDNPDVIERMRESRTGKNSPTYGRKITEDHQNALLEGAEKWRSIPGNMEKISQNLKELYSVPENTPFYGRKHTEETKAKMSENQAGDKNSFYGKKHSEETRAIISEKATGEGNSMYGRRGKNNPNYGKKRSDEFRESAKGSANSNAKGVEINGIVYGCIKDAARELGLGYVQLSQNIKYNREDALKKMGVFQFKLFNK